MKNTLTIIVLAIMALPLIAQPTSAVFTYDDSGNRTITELIVMLVEEDDPIEAQIAKEENQSAIATEDSETEVEQTEGSLSPNMFSLFPNPTQDYVNIRSEAAIENLKVIILDAGGAKIGSQNLKANQRVNMKSYAAGIYYLMIQSPTDHVTYKVIKNQ